MPLPDIMVAPTGARRSKADHPALPMDLDEIVAEARACHLAGAGALHAHVRDEMGRHSLDQGRYAELIAEMARAVPGMEVQASTEAAGLFGFDSQLAVIEGLRPAWASASVREMFAGGGRAQAARFYGAAADAGTRLQHILYDEGDAALLASALDDGTVPAGDNPEVIAVMGSYSGEAARMAGLEQMGETLLARYGAGNVAVCAFGAAELRILARARRLGLGARVGFENNIIGEDGRMATSNAAQVAALAGPAI